MKYVRWFDEIGKEDVALVGGENASLGEMIRNLQEKGVNVPSGFAITADVYKYLLQEAGIGEKIREMLAGLDTHDMANWDKRDSKIRSIVRNARCPHDLKEEIRTAYRELEERYGENVDMAVRSSPTAEDLPTASFAGQQETFLNVRGKAELMKKLMECFASSFSVFTNRELSYLIDKGFNYPGVYLSVSVQKMVRSDLACSGLMFMADTGSGFRDAVHIIGAYGLVENVVLETINPDQFSVFNLTLKGGFRPIVKKKLGTKRKKWVYNGKRAGTEQKNVKRKEQRRFVLSDEEVLTLARWVCVIDDPYGMPMEIEWAKDGLTNELFIVSTRQKKGILQKKY